MRSRIPRTRAPGPPMTTWRPGPSGPTRWTSGCPPDATSRQARHAPHGRAAGSSAVHSKPGGQVQRERRLADAGRTDEQDRVRRPAADHRADRGERGRLSAGPRAHPSRIRSGGLARAGRGLAGRLPLRLGLRPGGVPGRAVGGRGRRSCAWSVAWVRVPRRPPVPGSALGRGRLRRGCARRRLPGGAPLRRGRLAVLGWRGTWMPSSCAWSVASARRSSAASVPAASAVVASAGATASAAAGRVSVGRDSVVPGFWLTWARSIASSSGGTSLHGSLDEVGRGAASRGRSSRRAGPRSSRGSAVRCGVPAGPAADVRVAVDAATAATASVALALDRGLVRGASAARSATTALRATGRRRHVPHGAARRSGTRGSRARRSPRRHR